MQFSVTLLNQTGGPHLMRSETFSFSAQTPRMPFVSWLNLEVCVARMKADFYRIAELR